MNVIYQAMFYMLNLLHDIVGSYGLAIVLLTVVIRLALWPLNSAQTRSMRRMQEMQPKMKAIQERYKSEPQQLQQAMMKCYQESGLNPMAGCLPMLAQIPIFLGLYGALSSPQFLVETVHEKFLFLNNLSHTLQSHAGAPLDGAFDVMPKDTFSSDKTIRLTMNSGKVQEQEVSKTNELLQVSPKPLLPGSPMTMVLDFKALGLSDDYRQLVKSADVLVVNNQSRELEKIHFNNVNGVLAQTFETKAKPQSGPFDWNWDVLVLVILYGLLTLGYQRVMSAWTPKPAKDDASPSSAMQASTMKFMPLMFVGMMFFIPIPAGALIYLVVTTALMMIQTIWVNMAEDKRTDSSNSPSTQVINIKADRA